jgi:hypothetical protein
MVEITRSTLVENTGSTARDFCMLERNILSHVRLALLLALLSSSVLLRARLVPDDNPEYPPPSSSPDLPMAAVQFAASIAAIAAGIWQYQSGYRDLLNLRAFLVSTKWVIDPTHFI